ncbi:hypothetical protein F4782DRAFT_35023 [Xylaria castorea]|nr:hypothetical protein F4782DRAFT_35023 [Xylaria castorea]
MSLYTEEYKLTGNTALMSLMYRWDSATLDTCEGDVTKLSAELRAVRNGLIELDETCWLSEPFLVHKFLTSLGPSFEEFLTVFYIQREIIPLRNEDNVITKAAVTFDEAVTAAQSVQVRQRLRKADIDRLAAFDKGSRCTHCGGNHPPPKCFMKFPNLAPKGYFEKRSLRKQKRDRLKKEKRNP